jgi:hypothetical protein
MVRFILLEIEGQKRFVLHKIFYRNKFLFFIYLYMFVSCKISDKKSDQYKLFYS